MVMTMESLGRGKGRRILYLGILHIIGAILGGAIAGSSLGALGDLFSLTSWRTAFIVLASTFALWQSLSRRPARLGFYWQQVPRQWQHTMRADRCYYLWGILLGSGVATLIPYSSLVVLLATQFTSGITLGCLSGAVFGGMRELVALAPLLSKRYRLEPTKAGMLLSKLTRVVRILNVCWIISGGTLLVFTSLFSGR